MSTRGTSTARGSHWSDQAACRDEHSDVMFPEPGDADGKAYAKSICAGCPVLDACLAEALADEGGKTKAYRFGVRGGLTPSQRYARYRASRADEPEPEPVAEVTPGACGTNAGYARHMRHNTPPCDPCRAAHNADNRAREIVCGTRQGYQKHRRNGEKACDPCRYANAAADRRLRTTGSTLAV